MKPLLQTQLKEFNKRFNNFQDAEFREVKILSANEIELTLALQDANRDFDWITLTLSFSEVVDARLIDEEKLHLLDMSEGAVLIYDENMFAFGIGACYNISTIKNTSFYVLSKSLKYKEGSF